MPLLQADRLMSSEHGFQGLSPLFFYSSKLAVGREEMLPYD